MLVLIIRTMQLYIMYINNQKKKSTMNVYIQNIEIHFVIKTEI